MPKRQDTFKFRLDAEERAMLTQLAARLQRSQGDALRVVLREAVAALVPANGR